MNTVTTLTTGSIEQFRAYLFARGRSENTIRAYASDLRSLLAWTGMSSLPHHELPDSTATWLNATKRDAAPKTTGRRLVSVRAYAKWAGMGEILSDFIVPTPAKTRPHPLPEGIDGVVRMCEAATRPAYAALFALQGLMGLRVSEARSIRPEHFDLQTMVLTVRGKGDKTRHVPVSQKAWKFIEPAYTEAQFGNLYLVPISDGMARRLIRETGKELGFRRDISSHDLRATCATEMYRRTHNLRAVQEMLGHASITTTEIYTMIELDEMRAGMEF